jgi:glycosyltransferase involved in cell wall biosynthesis
MRLLYATSIIYPSNLANRMQILNNSLEFEKILGDKFVLGAQKVSLDSDYNNKNIYNFDSSPFSPLLGLRYTWYIYKNNYTHIYTREEMLYLFLYIYTRLIFWRKYNFIYEIHWNYKHNNPIVNYLFYATMRKADLIVSISQKLISDLLSIGLKQNKIIFSPDGVNLEDYLTPLDIDEFKNKHNIPLDKKIISYVGSYKTLNIKKGTDELIKAYTNLIKTHKNIFLLFVGPGEDGKKELDTDMYTLGIKDENFKVISRVAHKEVANFLRISDLQIMNYPWSTHFAYYMSPLKLFEYMASGKPLISTDLPSVRDILDDSMAIFCAPGDASDLESKMDKFLQNENEGITKAQRARQEILKYTWEERVKNIVNSIKSK